MTKKTRNILIVAGAIILGFIAWYFRSIVTYIIVAAVISSIGRPIMQLLQKVKIGKFRLNASVRAFLTLMALLLFFIGFFVFMIPLIAGEFKSLASVDYQALLLKLDEPVKNVSKLFMKEPISLATISIPEIATSKLASFFRISQVTDLFGTIAGTIGEIMMGVFSVSFISFFFLKEEGMFRNGLLALTPRGSEERFSRSFDRITHLLNRYFIGLVLEVILVATLVTIGMLIIGLNFGTAILIGLICGLFNVIPYLGPWIGGALGMIIAFAINVNAPFMEHTLPVLGFMIVVFAVSQVIDNVIFQPLIYSSSVKAHPLEIFLVIMAAGSMVGITGMILAVPVYTILRVFAAEFLSGFKVVQKLTANMDGDVLKKD
ncbi:MAG TPA: AI-2E family transporter [Prolixibacteraceae bacterium]|nr:AI-2E family transporter [Prolixibacteraceae bacterium]HPS12575.1 AI-2E family transporter [Prolixibacteraceae bacterium]